MEVYIGVALVLCSAFTHSVWNLFTKKSLHKATFLWSLHLIASIIFMPFFIKDLIHLEAGLKEWGFLLLSFMFQGIYFLMLSKAYQVGELSRIYPMMRGMAALLVPLFSLGLYGEQLTGLGWFGLACIVGGLFAIGGLMNPNWKEQGPLLKIAFIVGLCTTGYTLTDKFVVSFMTPLGLLQLGNLAAFFILIPDVVKAKQVKEEWRMNWRTILLGAVLTPGSYLIFLFAMKLAPLAQIAPMREFSIVFGTVLGMLILKEKQGLPRMAMALLITCGMMLVGLFGTPV